MEYWEEQQLKQTGYFEEAPKPTAPDPIAGKSALEGTLQEVKKTLWNMERHTSETQSRLDKNNKSGPSHPLYQISKWGESAVLDMMLETLVEIQDTIENSAIARKSDSPLEKSLAIIHESTVTFNEKTMRWHDDQTNLMVKGDDPRVEATKFKPEAVEAEIHWGATIAGFVSDIKGDTSTIIKLQKSTRKLIGRGFFGKKKDEKDEPTAEEQSEGDTDDKNAEKGEKDKRTSLKGIWASMKERAKKNWFVENWPIVLAALVFLFAPLKWIWKLWSGMKSAWEFTKKHPLIAAMIALGAVIIGPLNLLLLGFKALKSTLITGFKIAKWAGGGIKTFLQSRGMGMAGHMTPKMQAMSAARAANAAKMGPRVGKAVPLARKIGMKMSSMGESTKGIFGSLVKKFGSAGRWIAKLGSKLIMPLVTTPIGWAILGGLALGALAYIYWDDIKKIWGKITNFISETFSKVSEFASNMVGSAKSMLGNFLRSVGAGMIADWIDPDGADKSKPAKEFTWKNFGLELWNIYTGIWGKIIDLAKSPLKAIGKVAAGFARSMGMDTIADWLDGEDEEEPKTLEGKKQKQRDIIQTEKDRITRSKAGIDEYGVSADNMFGREGEGQSESKEKIDTAQKELTKLIVDDRKGRKKKAQGFATKTGKMSFNEYIVSPEGQEDRKDSSGAVGYSTEEQLQAYEEYAGVQLPLEGEEPAPVTPKAGQIPSTSAPMTMGEAYAQEMTKKSVNLNLRRMREGPRGNLGGRMYRRKMKLALDPLKSPNAKPLWDAMKPEEQKQWKHLDPYKLEKDRSSKFASTMRTAMPGTSTSSYQISPAQSPDDKMNTFNSIQEKNRTLQDEKSGNPAIISVIKEGDSKITNQTGGIFPMANPVHAPRLRESNVLYPDNFG